jgi:hypothetical protein
MIFWTGVQFVSEKFPNLVKEEAKWPEHLSPQEHSGYKKKDENGDVAGVHSWIHSAEKFPIDSQAMGGEYYINADWHKYNEVIHAVWLWNLTR